MRDLKPAVILSVIETTLMDSRMLLLPLCGPGTSQEADRTGGTPAFCSVDTPPAKVSS